ncbi:MAG: (d)CMP kinase [Actinomycetota bacterium]
MAVVAIDGTAGSGKSTLARGLARTLDLPYVNTGVMYRALARAALDEGIDPSDGPALASVAGRLRFTLGPHGADGVSGIEVEGSPPGPDLETPEVEAIVSGVARHPEVRAVLVERQRALAGPGAVVEGRDIGTVVFPDAPVKLFLTADPRARAERRAIERAGAADEAVVAENLQRRDRRDAVTNPFDPAPGAVVIDASERSIEQVLALALDIARAAGVAGPDLTGGGPG